MRSDGCTASLAETACDYADDSHADINALWINLHTRVLAERPSDGGHEARRLQLRRPAAVRCSALASFVKSFSFIH